MACTCLKELCWHPDLIELQMAHAERNQVRAAYSGARRLAERREMVRARADHLDWLRAGSCDVSHNAHAPREPVHDAVDMLRTHEKAVRDDAVPQLQIDIFVGE